MNRNGRAPQAGSVAPQAGQAPSQAGQASSQAGSVAPQAGSVAPQAGSVAPQAGSVAPQARKAPSQARKAPSQARKAPSQARKAPSQAGKVAPQAGRATPQPRRRTLAAYQPKAAMAQRLLAAQTALDTTLRDPALLELLAAHGYDTAKILEGQALIAAARARHQQQRDHRGDRIAATDTPGRQPRRGARDLPAPGGDRASGAARRPQRGAEARSGGAPAPAGRLAAAGAAVLRQRPVQRRDRRGAGALWRDPAAA
ncbi:MAG: hypothetical protein IPO81_17255 [Kouleothrix sp.]|nr:hypothetical protein [Kouleothrix sp.]